MATLNNLSQIINISLKFLKSNGLPSRVCRNAGHLSARRKAALPASNARQRRGPADVRATARKLRLRQRHRTILDQEAEGGDQPIPRAERRGRRDVLRAWVRAGIIVPSAVRASGCLATDGPIGRPGPGPFRGGPAGRVGRPNAHHGPSSPTGSEPVRSPRRPPPRSPGRTARGRGQAGRRAPIADGDRSGRCGDVSRHRHGPGVVHGVARSSRSRLAVCRSLLERRVESTAVCADRQGDPGVVTPAENVELAGLTRIMRDREGVGPLASAEYLRTLKSPFPLLEGHRRLSFLNGLRQRGKALPQHEVWLARKIG